MSNNESIKEKDKPFILAIIASAITIIEIAIASFGAFTGNVIMKDTGIETLKFTFPLTTMAWTFYFTK